MLLTIYFSETKIIVMSLKQEESPEELQKQFDHVKSQVLKYIKERFSGTIVDWQKKMKDVRYADELNIGAALAELAYERKAALLDTKHILDGSEAGTGLIIMGIYGPPKHGTKK